MAGVSAIKPSGVASTRPLDRASITLSEVATASVASYRAASREVFRKWLVVGAA